MSLNEELKRARKASGLTQDDAAKALGTKNTTISNWENGVSRPDVDALSALCKLYGVTPNDLLEYDSDSACVLSPLRFTNFSAVVIVSPLFPFDVITIHESWSIVNTFCVLFLLTCYTVCVYNVEND